MTTKIPCPHCQHDKSKIKSIRYGKLECATYRLRQCNKCGEHFPTYEMPKSDFLKAKKALKVIEQLKPLGLDL